MKMFWTLPERTATGKAAAALRMIPSNKAEREMLVEVLAQAGIYRAPSGIDDEAATEFLAGIG